MVILFNFYSNLWTEVISDIAWCYVVITFSDYKAKIGFTGQLLIEPKPKEPTKHQYDYGKCETIWTKLSYSYVGGSKIMQTTEWKGGGVRGVWKPQSRTEIRLKTANRIETEVFNNNK